MNKNYKFIKTALLLSALSSCWQGDPLAMEEVEKRGDKRKLDQAALLNQDPDCCFKGFPDETISKIIQYFDLKKDQNTLLALMTSCKTFFHFGNHEYSEANKAERHYPWQDNLSLNPSTVYILNTRMLRILGLYNNIMCYNNMAEDRDRIRFERLCDQFANTPLFSAPPVAVNYVTMLRCDVEFRNLTPFQLPFRNDFQKALETKKQKSIDKLSRIANQLNPVLQNEATLYFHFCQFVYSLAIDQLTSLKNTPLFGQLNGSLMRVMDQELLSLKQTPGLSNAGYFAKIWKKIIDLESMATIRQLGAAAYSYFQIGYGATDHQVKLESLTKSAKYLEEQLSALRNAGQIPTAFDYAKIASAYFQIGVHATDHQVKLESFAKAQGYFQICLKEEIPEELSKRVYVRLAQISTYLGSVEKGAHHENLNESSRDG